MPEDKVTPESAVRAAAQEHNVELTEETAEDTESSQTEGTQTSDEKVEEEATSKTAELDARTMRALQILDQLEDNEQGPALVKAMARQIGLIQDTETKKEASKAAESAKEKIIAKLGEDYPMLAESLGTLIDDLLNEQQQKFNHEINVRERARYEADIDSRVVKFIADKKVTEAEQAEITKLAAKFPPSPSVPPEEYLAYHLKHVRAEQEEAKAKAKTNSKIRANLAESPANKGVAANEEQIVKAPKLLTPMQAVQMAMRGESVSD